MFDRKAIKEQAKALIKRSYWLLVAVVFVAGLLGATVGGGTTTGINLNFGSGFNDVDESVTDNPWMDNDVDDYYDNDWDDRYENDWDDQYDNDWDDNFDPNPDNWFDEMTNGWGEAGRTITAFLLIFVVLGILAVIFGTLFHVFISNIVTVGVNGWLMRYWRGETPPFGDLFASFRTYAPVVKAMFLRDLFTFLWSLLFIVPGIIKSLAYAMVPYIIYENPNLTPGQALKISVKMTDGYKGDLFVLGLSFIGWNLLSALTGGILGALYVNPYICLTYAGVYDQLKWNALQDGRLSWSDFGQVQPVYEEPVAAEGFGG